MSKVTYLIGAGASCDTLPLVSTFPNFVQSLLNHLNESEFQLSDADYFSDYDLSKTKKEYQRELRNSFNWLIKESMRHASIDTYAKKLFLKGEMELLEKLKHCISFYFILAQAYHGLDMRYDAFFASILSKLDSLPEEINILSWNYDFQIELAFSDYIESSSIHELHSKLNIYSKFFNQEIKPGFGIFKLNGTTSLKKNIGDEQLIENLPEGLNKALFEDIVRKHAVISNYPNFKSSLSFAWEDDLKDFSITDHAVRQTHETEYLIVIGYSFPFFNRDVDRLLIKSMGHLKKVYFQDTSPDLIIDRFKAIRDDIPNENLLPIKNVNQFYLPSEL